MKGRKVIDVLERVVQKCKHGGNEGYKKTVLSSLITHASSIWTSNAAQQPRMHKIQMSYTTRACSVCAMTSLSLYFDE